MNTPSLSNELLQAVTALANVLAQDKTILVAKERIGVFFQNPDSTKLFEEVNAYGEELRQKHLAGMPPTEEEIAKFDTLRGAVISDDVAREFLESRTEIDTIMQTLSQYLGMSIDLGRAPTPEEVEAAREQSMSTSCACGADSCDSCQDDSCNCQK